VKKSCESKERKKALKKERKGLWKTGKLESSFPLFHRPYYYGFSALNH
jgi:hypothetical protein